MPHFLIKNEEINKDFINLTDKENLFHICKVLRAKIGEEIKFIDENQNVYLTKITNITKISLEAEIIEKTKSERILKTNLCLIQSILMSDAQNSAISNAVQSGIKEIYPVISDNTSTSLNSVKNKIEKWEKVALENFKQCERADLPIIHEVMDLKTALNDFKKENILIFAEKFDNIDIDKSLNDLNKNEKIAIVIGPEGGFSDCEFEYFKKENYKLLSLGKMIYKAPNAITAAISNVITRIE